MKPNKITRINWLLQMTLLLSAVWLGVRPTTAQAQAEQSFGIPSAWARAMTVAQGWGAEHPRLLAYVNGDQRQDVVGFGDHGVWLATASAGEFTPKFVLADFGYQSGWRVQRHVRTLGDVNGDGLEDIVGFGDAGVYRALSNGSGFGPATFVIADFGYNQGWRVDRHVRLLADVNGDGKKDIVAFGDAGVWLALATASGYFAAPQFVVAEFGYNQGWTPAYHPRLTADINGDSRQDIVGFANDGVWVALSTGNGFGPAQRVLGEFGYVAGGWHVDRHLRLLADVNGDGQQDIVGFGDAGIWTALSTGSGFAAAQFVLAGFGYDQGWQVGKHPRFVADLNGDGYQDIVGFGDESVYRALGGPTGFTSTRGVFRDLVAESGFPWNSAPDVLTDSYPRLVGDVDGDGKQDLVAFDATEIKIAYSSDLPPSPPPNEDPLRSDSFGGRDIGAALATLPAAAINSVVIPQTGLVAERAPKPPCNAQKIAEVLAPATAAAPSVRIDCSLTLRSSDVITKRLLFVGDNASGVTVEGNGATINGGSGTFNYSPSHPEDMVEIHSSRYQDPATGELRWARPENITLRNCKIIGSVTAWGMEKWGDRGFLRSSSRLSGHVTRVRNSAPRNIVLDHVTITGVGTRVPLYLHAGVSYFQMFDSWIKGSSGKHVNIYLDAESYRNTFRNNRIEADTSEREVMAVDGSSHNLIVNNFFSSLDHGGIYLYRNCGEEGIIRHSTPSSNTIVNNVFYYRQYDGDNPAIFVASRNGNRNYCDDDDGYPFGSSASNYDYAQFNVVMQNQIFKPQSVSKMIKVGRPDLNTPNYINYNETVTAEIERKAGCYISNGYQKDFIRDGEFINLFRNANGEPICTGYRLTCHDGTLSQSSDSTCRPVGYVDFECQASGSNSGCQKTAFSPAGKTIIGAKAACNLEFGTVSVTELNGVSANFVKVLRASDNVSEGSCTLGSTSIRSGQAAVSGLNGLTRLSFGCRENDANGGDCHIKGRLYYQ